MAASLLQYVAYVLGLIAAAWLGVRLMRRLNLSRAKHRSLRGHSKISCFVARLIPFYEYDETTFFRSDGAPDDVAEARRRGFETLARGFEERSPRSIEQSRALEAGLSDAQFINTYRVPFQYRRLVKSKLRLGTLLAESSGTRVRDLDGNWSYDLTGSYGVNVFGYDFYKDCVDRGIERVRGLGPVLGSLHPVIADNIERLERISGLDEVSFHMSGTEAVMQAVRLARFNTRRSRLVMFCGAYHGWWDGVQPGIGSDRPLNDVYLLKEMSDDTLRVLGERKDIACVLVNPIQVMHPNSSAPGDGALVDSSRSARVDKAAYADWLRKLRDVCTRRSIALIFDEVFVGFRIAYGGAQEYFGVHADMVTYGKTLGGGLPVGVVCGKAQLMKRFRDDRPTQMSFARGTFNSHPYVMGAMNEFLRRIDEPSMRQQYENLDEIWNARVEALNAHLRERDLPLRVVNLVSIWTVIYTRPSRYNWMLQFYLRAEGLALSWVGTGRLILSHNYTDEDVAEVSARFVRAAQRMQSDGWWWQSLDASDRSIRRQVLKEILRARTRRSTRPKSG